METFSFDKYPVELSRVDQSRHFKKLEFVSFWGSKDTDRNIWNQKKPEILTYSTNRRD
jgi:hypothetical protein